LGPEFPPPPSLSFWVPSDKNAHFCHLSLHSAVWQSRCANATPSGFARDPPPQYRFIPPRIKTTISLPSAQRAARLADLSTGTVICFNVCQLAVTCQLKKICVFLPPIHRTQLGFCDGCPSCWERKGLSTCRIKNEACLVCLYEGSSVPQQHI